MAHHEQLLRGKTRIRLAALGAVTVVTALFAAQASFAGASGGLPCIPKITTIAGKHAVINCGPAVVTVRLSGKSYTFKNGFCSQSKTAKEALNLDVGTLVLNAKGNAGKPYLSLLMASSGPIASVFEADWNGKQLFGDTLIKHSGNLPSTESFVSDFGPHFHRTWDCHGVIYQSP